MSGKSQAPFRPSRARTRGVSRSSRTLDAGSGGRFGASRRTALTRTAKSCGPDIPTLISSGRQCLRIAACDGDNKPGSPGRSRRKPLKPLRGESRMIRQYLWWTNSCAFFTCTRGYGCVPRTRLSLRPRHRGSLSCRTRARMCRENADDCPMLFWKSLSLCYWFYHRQAVWPNNKGVCL